MYIETVKRKVKGKLYAYTLLRKSYRDSVTKQPRHETLLNLTKWSPSKIDALRALIQGDKLKDSPQITLQQGKGIGGLWMFNELAKRCGLSRILGYSRKGKIALLLIIGRLITQGSRLQLYEWAKHQEIEAVLGLKELKKDELYETLDWLSEQQSRIENRLYTQTEIEIRKRTAKISMDFSG